MVSVLYCKIVLYMLVLFATIFSLFKLNQIIHNKEEPIKFSRLPSEI